MARRERHVPASIDATLDLLAAAITSPTGRSRPCCSWRCRMGRPLFLEGEAGVGKTEIAKVLAATLGRRLIRLQCYEGLDVAAAVYEWNYAAQMIAIRLAEAEARAATANAHRARRVLRALPDQAAAAAGAGAGSGRRAGAADRRARPHRRAVRGVPARGARRLPGHHPRSSARSRPSIRRSWSSPRTARARSTTRLKRRCLYHWVGYPDAERELQIVRAKVPGIGKKLSRRSSRFVQALRKQDLFKAPGVAETLDWATALTELDAVALDPATVSDTLGVLLKYQDDIARLEGSKAKELLDEVRAELRAAE